MPKRFIRLSLFLLALNLCQHVSAQWQNIYSFPNPAYALLTHKEMLYAGLGGGGVFMSQDSGVTWVAVNNGIQFGGAYIFSLASRNDSIYAGGFGEVCLTADGGENWSLLGLNLDLNSYVYSLALQGDYLFAAAGHGDSNGVYRKPVSGGPWVRLVSGLPGNIGINAMLVSGSLLFAGTDSAVYVSQDSGLNWNLSGNGIPFGNKVMSLFLSDSTILAGTNDGVFVSMDHGLNWIHAGGLPAGSVVTSFSGNNEIVVSGTYESAFFSKDFGLNWQIMNLGLDSVVSFYSLATLDKYIFAGTGAGISTTNSVFRLSYAAVSVPELVIPDKPQCTLVPNPLGSHGNIVMGKAIKNADIEIVSMTGAVVQSICHVSGQLIPFDRKGLPNGTYLIRVKEPGQGVISTIIVLSD